jgi:hypothetical protein
MPGRLPNRLTTIRIEGTILPASFGNRVLSLAPL